MADAADRRGRKTVRFTQVVERSGEPQVHTLWLPPNKDPELQRAQKANRVMTIEPGSAGGKTDVGTIGFETGSGKPAQFLIFPKSLKSFEGARVVGIKFDLVAQPKLAAVDPLQHAKSTRPRGGTRKDSRTGTSNQTPAPTSTDAKPKAEERETISEEVPNLPDIVPFEPPSPSPKEGRREKSSSEKTSRPSKAAKPKKEKEAAIGEHAKDATALIREVRAAMKDLERGKSVAAYQRLARAIDRSAK